MNAYKTSPALLLIHFLQPLDWLGMLCQQAIRMICATQWRRGVRRDWANSSHMGYSRGLLSIPLANTINTRSALILLPPDTIVNGQLLCSTAGAGVPLPVQMPFAVSLVKANPTVETWKYVDYTGSNWWISTPFPWLHSSVRTFGPWN